MSRPADAEPQLKVAKKPLLLGAERASTQHFPWYARTRVLADVTSQTLRHLRLAHPSLIRSLIRLHSETFGAHHTRQAHEVTDPLDRGELRPADLESVWVQALASSNLASSAVLTCKNARRDRWWLGRLQYPQSAPG